ncbi:MAG TPA: nickel pincer cofactor biosynthesis protein LarC [Roseiflexaceae bacterium]|nr:nickel pincer cofactor biosynthesis protein LarC [Roseiflexaceae bacterium]
MPKAIYFDCFSGISGDMALGALLDAGLDLEALRGELRKLGLGGWAIEAERGRRGFLAGTRARVHAPEQPTHRHLADVRAIIAGSALAPAVQERSLRVFGMLAEAEGRVHGIPAEQVHFHEVGALDAIVDIVGVVAGLALLEVAEVYASPLPLGSGWVRAAHGLIPVPAPATLELLAAAGAPTVPDEARAELVTPTGAALLAALAQFRRPAMRLERVGCGLGTRELERPNALRVWLGITEAAEGGDVAESRQQRTGGGEQAAAAPASAPSAPSPSSAILLETNIDDQPAEQIAYACERLLALGALDAWLQPIQMKKGRPGMLLAALVPAVLEPEAVALIMRETTTLGVRRRELERHICEREVVAVETPLGPVRVKRKRWQGRDMGAAPEYEDCARIARERGIPLREVYALVARVWEGQGAA